MALRRLQKEYRDISKEPNESISAAPLNEADMFTWGGTVRGPQGTPYEGGLFHLNIHFPTDYPFKPPKVTFITKVYHPNVNTDGGICLDILKDEWTPALSIPHVLLSISALMAEPNPDHPLVPDVAQLYKQDKKAFEEKAREWTKQYAQ
jgi:ubiquitin-conjugating enzyme E2 D/E